VGVAAYLLTRERKNPETLAVTIPEIPKSESIKTGDLVKTIGHWEGWITLGIAYNYKDVNPKLCELNPERDYIYVQAIAGELLNNNAIDLTKLGGYRETNLQLLSSMEEK
jgi:hypothetical protein